MAYEYDRFLTLNVPCPAITEVLIIFVLLLVNGFFALSEIAIVSASKPLLRQMAKQGSGRAEAALDLAENPGKFLSTVQVGITLVGILAGAYGGAAIAEDLAPHLNAVSWINPHGQVAAVALIVSAITYFSVVIGELVPKQFALAHAEGLAMFVAPIMKGLSWLTSPVVLVLNFSAQSLLTLLRVQRGEGTVTEEEVRAILTESAESGVIDKAEHEMLQRVIRLADRDVKSIMTHRTDVVFIDVNDTLDTIRTKVHDAGHSRYPVVEGGGDNVVGIVQAKEMLDARLSGEEFSIRGLMREAHILPEHISCLAALETFKQHHINLMIIVDEYGSTQGIVTPSDFLEAIVGTIASNYGDADQPMIVQRADGSWLVDGRTPIEEIHLSIGIETISADEDFDTIAGYMLTHMRAAPTEGASFNDAGYSFEVVDMDHHRIDKILITKIEDAGIAK